MDVDAVLLDDLLRHMHSRALCGRFHLLFGSEAELGGLQNGVAYACGALRDGAAAWVMAEVIDRYLRVADACGGSHGGYAPAPGRCSPGSWLHGVRQAANFFFDQRTTLSVLESAATRDGRQWWLDARVMAQSVWPFSRNSSLVDSIDRALLSIRGSARVLDKYAGPIPRVGPGRGEALPNVSHFWTISPLLDGSTSAGGVDASASWAKRFQLGDRKPKVLWSRISAAPPLARQLHPALGSLLDGAWQAAACASERRRAKVPSQGFRWGDACTKRPAAHKIGQLPHTRGGLSRAWQRLLDGDLDAAAGSAAPGGDARRALAVVAPSGAVGASVGQRDGHGGARWAVGSAGDEAVALLPSWLASHWTVAQRGTVGSLVPHVVVLHATK